jgi:hypothetical protein
MIAPSVVEKIRELLAEGKLSQRKIARAVGVSRGTVDGIASGRRADPAPRSGDEFEEPLGPLGRCPECGGRVYMPCRLCRVRNTAESSSSRPRRVLPDDAPVGLQLKEEHQRRYEEVVARRVRGMKDPR